MSFLMLVPNSGWDALRSRISGYGLASDEFPQWDEEREEILPSKCYLSGEVIYHPKEQGKVKFRVNRQWLIRIHAYIERPAQ